MPPSRYDWLNRVKAVEREHASARFAVEHLLNTIRIDPTILGRDLRIRDIEKCANQLEGTYLLPLRKVMSGPGALCAKALQATGPGYTTLLF